MGGLDAALVSLSLSPTAPPSGLSHKTLLVPVKTQKQARRDQTKIFTLSKEKTEGFSVLAV